MGRRALLKPDERRRLFGAAEDQEGLLRHYRKRSKTLCSAHHILLDSYRRMFFFRSQTGESDAGCSRMDKRMADSSET
jgi:hypothetical protein